MSDSTTATVETLIAGVRVLMVGLRQVTIWPVLPLIVLAALR